jgi:6-phosphogluconolactonase (cycloisomerase 2 family)
MKTLSGAGAVSPAAFAMDSSGKFLFVADQATTDSSGAAVAGSVSVFSVSSGSVTEVPNSPFAVPGVLGGTNANVLALDVSKTSFPALSSACSGNTTAPTTENLYVADAANNQVFEYSVDPSSGALASVSALNGPGIATGSVPSGIAVDPCNRFVYVANHDSNNVSGYTICNATLLPNCQKGDGSLVSTGTPISAGTGPVALAVDPRGNFVYVVNQVSNNLSGYKISPVTGILTSFTTIGTGGNPVSIAIRADDNWLFVTNNQSASISQFSLIPASGAITPVAATTTDNFPWGVAVK